MNKPDKRAKPRYQRRAAVDRRRASALSGLVVMAGIASASAQPATDWLEFVPADARFYVEFRDLTRLRDDYRKLSIWLAISELGAGNGGPASRAASQPRMESWLGMTREEAVTKLLGHRTAVIADSPTNWREGIVLAEVSEPAEVPAWLKRWGAERISEVRDVSVYELRNAGSMRLAVRKALLVFAPGNGPIGRWQNIVELLSAAPGGSAICGVPEIKAMLNSLSPGGNGLLILNDPSPGGARLAATMRSSATRLNIDVEWMEQVTSSAPRPGQSVRMADLPPDAMVTWCGWFDGAAWLRGLRKSSAVADGGSALQWLHLLYGQTLLSEQTLGRLGPRAAVVVQSDPAANTGYITPTLTLLLESRDAEKSAMDLAGLLKIAVGLMNTQLARAGADITPLDIEQTTLADGILYRIPIGRALSIYTSCPYLPTIDLAWTADGDRLLISTSADAVLRLRRSPAALASGPASQPLPARLPATQAAATALTISGDLAGASQWFRARGTEISNMMQNWLRYAGQQSPNAVRSSWWRSQALRRARENQRFGVTLRGEPLDGATGAARVLEVAPDSPAGGILFTGDLIVMVEGDGLPLERPAREVAERFRQRAAGGEFYVEIVRAGQRLPLRIDMPEYAYEPEFGFSPVRAIFPLMVITRPMTELNVTFRDEPPGRRRATIVINWRTTEPKP